MLALISSACNAFSGQSTTVTEYLALAPTVGGAGAGSKIEWVKLDYPVGVSSANDVTISSAPSTVAELGSWASLDPDGLALSAKIMNNTMYALHDASGEGTGGCCADTLNIFPKDGTSSSVALDTIVAGAFGSAVDAHVSHTFDVTVLPDGTPAALLVVKYTEATLGDAPADAILALNLNTFKTIPTAGGKAYLDMFSDAGTLSLVASESRYKIQFYYEPYSPEGGTGAEQWHGNGVARFTTKAGTTLLAFTHRMASEAVIMKCPWTYKAGAEIVQRFGTPWGWTDSSGANPVRRYFGLQGSPSTFDTGVHNVYYRSYSEALDGKESISLFDGVAAAYEFELKPVSEGSTDDTGDDTVFDCKYVFAKCTFAAQAQGGARAIGNGVFAVMGGAVSTLQIADTAGATKSHAYSLGGSPPLYDPFLFVYGASSAK